MSLPFVNYSRPGPGLSKDQVENERFRFFKIFSRKFLKLVKINLLYFVSIIIFFIPAAVVTTAQNPGSNLFFYISLLPIAFTSPMTAGFVFVMRNFARQQHVFLWYDYWNTIKSNWRQALCSGLISIIFFIFVCTAFNFYYSQMLRNALYIAPLIILCVISAIVLFMQYYIYLLMISFNLKLRQIYKNAFIFSVINLFRNISVTMLLCLIALLCWIAPILLVLVPFLLLSTFGFIAVYNAWPVIQKHMIDTAPQNAVNGAERSVFADSQK